MNIDNFSQNPIDIVEEVIYSKRWSFSRSADHELVAEISTRWCQYRLYFSWSEQIKAINFTVTFDIRFPEVKYKSAYELLALINEKLWLGHFDITSKNGIPAYRQTVLEFHDNQMLHSQLEDLMDIAIYECEKYYPSFQQVLFEEIPARQSLVFANFEFLY